MSLSVGAQGNIKLHPTAKLEKIKEKIDDDSRIKKKFTTLPFFFQN
jgi:hypothetical protein